MKDLLTISYRSVSCLRKPADEISSILSESLSRNQRLGITGLLLFDGNFLLQTLEGPPVETKSVYAKIICDLRHTNITLLSTRLIRTRVFPTVTARLRPQVTSEA
ncbi:hypothetical protein BMG03_19295 (plasmid) [Thioclava nitratireducens]|uniref:BLUF domain-containing protein n=1 Tax=Thioclava nitratireducens TaxID=1915078 RepID=A0ABN4XKI8_9RHOB|nr:hypothetical protein BMG03_19295 [Thioclava nitratireducens]